MAMMTATKMLTYNNRRLVPGEDFEARSHRDMKVLLATRKAKLKREEGAVPAPPPEVAKKIVAVTGTQEPAPSVTASGLRSEDVPPSVAVSGNDGDKGADPVADAQALTDARAEYKRVTGKQPYHGWAAEHLRELTANYDAAEGS